MKSNTKISLKNLKLKFDSQNNLFTTFVGTDASQEDKSKLLYFRLLASVPPIIGAAMLSKLGTITDYAGVAGFVIGFMFPAALAYMSEKYMRERKMDPRTYYSGAHTGAISWIAVFSFGIFKLKCRTHC